MQFLVQMTLSLGKGEWNRCTKVLRIETLSNCIKYKLVKVWPIAKQNITIYLVASNWCRDSKKTYDLLTSQPSVLLLWNETSRNILTQNSKGFESWFSLWSLFQTVKNCPYKENGLNDPKTSLIKLFWKQNMEQTKMIYSYIYIISNF